MLFVPMRNWITFISLYVDQWDWEAVINESNRNVAFLKNVVERIYSAIRRTEYLVCETYQDLKPFLPKEIHFIHSEELCNAP